MGSRVMPREGAASLTLDWAVAARAYADASASGDMYVLRPFEGGVLVGVVDALGHGPEAEATARLAVATLEQYAHEPPPNLIERCHRILVGTRGAAMGIGSIDWMDQTMTWLAIGDVDGRLFAWARGRSPPRALIRRGGIVGAGTLPSVRPWVVPIARGDLLLLVTDGVRGTFAEGIRTADPPQHIADDVLARHGKGTDDALVLVVRIPPPPQESGS